MAKRGQEYIPSEEVKELSIKYVESSGLFKNRLADYLGVSRPTLDRVLQKDFEFFTSLKRADSRFCQNLIEKVSQKDPKFLLLYKYGDEFRKKTSFEIANSSEPFFSDT